MTSSRLRNQQKVRDYPAPSSGGSLRSRPTFVGTLAAVFLASLTFGISLPLVPQMVVVELEGSPQSVGWVFGAFTMTSVALRPAMGIVGDHLGRRYLLLPGGVLSAIGLAAHAYADGVFQLALSRAVAGGGYGALLVGLIAVCYDVSPSDRHGEVSNYLMVAMQLGIGIGPLIGARGAALWTMAMVWGVAAVLAAAGAAVGLACAGKPSVARVHNTSDRSSRLIAPSAVPAGFVILTAIAGFAVFLSYVPLFAAQVGTADVSVVLLLSSATVVLARLGSARVVTILGTAPTVSIGIGLQASGLGLMASWPTPTGLYLSTVVMSAGWAVTPPALMGTSIQHAPPGKRASVVSTFTMFMDLGMAASPALLGAVVALIGIRGMFVLAAATGLGGLFALWLWAVPRWKAAVVSEA